jgi:phosphohistidine swiveling domain-containing protein
VRLGPGRGGSRIRAPCRGLVASGPNRFGLLARHSGVALDWVVDTEPDPRFSLYTRGNTGEVFPHVITPLTGTLIGESVRAAQLDLFVAMGALRRDEITRSSAGTGVFGGYLYMNGSLMRLFGVRMPGMSPTSGDEQVIGAVEGLPPHRMRPGDRSLVASARLSLTSLRLLRSPDLGELRSARDSARSWLATKPDLTAAPDDDLLAWIHTYPPRIGASMERLLRSSIAAAVPREILDRLLGGSKAAPGLVNRMVGGNGDVDSAEPARRLWDLGRLVAADPGLTAAFDAGLADLERRTAGSALSGPLADFLHDHGHRGNDEYELATPAWAMDPGPVYASIDRLRRAPAERDPRAAHARLAADAADALEDAVRIVPRPLRAVVRRATAVARAGSIARERAKDILVLENLGARQVLHELVGRAAARGGPTDVRLAFCVAIDELPAFVADPVPFASVLQERRDRQQYLDDRIPPPWFEGRIPDPSTWPRRDDAAPAAPASGTTIGGIAVHGGVARGPARVIHDPGDPRGIEPGEVLVCAITDPSWTPLFLSAAAVVCDTGAMQSHAAIVARELGIPAVLSVPGITSVADGTMLHVDGNTGEVRIG